MKKNFLKTIFGKLWHSRHYRRFLLLSPAAQPALNRDIPVDLTDRIRKASRAAPEELISGLKTSAEGLTESEAGAIRGRFGLNEVEGEKPLSAWCHLWLSYANSFNILLSVLALISLLTGDHEAAVIILVMVALSTLLRFWQERKAHREADALKAMVGNTATVKRRQEQAGTGGPVEESRRIKLPIKFLVPGDIIILAAGDLIPADCRVLADKDLFLSQAAMTGEALPVEKFAVATNAETRDLLDLDNILFMGTNVVSGSATAVVVGTGRQSYFGALAVKVIAQDHVPTSFQNGINQVGWALLLAMLVTAPLVLLINGLTKGNWIEAVLFSCSVAVGLTPEMLPMVVTATLAKGAVFLSRRKVVVKRLDSIQNLGEMRVLCTDKTGTLTQNKIVLSRHVDTLGGESDEVLKRSWLNSFFQSGLENLLDAAVLESAKTDEAQKYIHSFKKVDEIPFDFERRRMSVVVKAPDGEEVLICKGAAEEVLSACVSIRRNGQVEDMTPEVLKEAQETATRMNKEGFRVVAVAVKHSDRPKPEAYKRADESALTLIGYISFLDPPKESAAPALKLLSGLGVSTKVLTGDNELVANKICREVGFQIELSDILPGSVLEDMDDNELAVAVEKTQVFAKLTPAHKARVVAALKTNGHVVGFLGDGINDAAALRTADIGISVDSGVDIAKEAADIILLEKSLLILEKGVRESRRTICNMMKYIKITASSNFGNVFSVLIASVFLPFLPMLPIHLLIQNLLYDTSQAAIPFDNVDEELLIHPRQRNFGNLLRFMVVFGPLSSIFDIITFLVMWYVFKANNEIHQTLFQSGWFVVGLVTQTLVVHFLRTPKLPFIQSRPAPPLIFMTVFIIAVGLFLPMGPLAPYLKLQALPPSYFLYLFFIVAAYSALTQTAKSVFIKHFGWQ